MKKLLVTAVLLFVFAGPAVVYAKQHRPPKPLHKNPPHPYTKHKAAKHPTPVHPHRNS